MKSILGLAVVLGVFCVGGEAFAQCNHSGGGGQRGGGQRGGSQGFSQASFGQFGGGVQFGGGGQFGGGQFGGAQCGVAINQQGCGSQQFAQQMMLQNFALQQVQRQQAAIAAEKQAQEQIRKGKQLDTRRTQRDEELARREERKRAAGTQLNLYSANQARLASASR